MTQDRRSLIRSSALGAAGAGVLGLLPSCAVAADDASAAAAALLRRYVALKNAHDATRCGEIYADTYVEHSGRNPSGLPALVANWQGQFAGIPDLRLVLEDQVVAGDKAVARMTYSGTHTRPFLPNIAPTGRAFSFATIDIWRIAGGKFAEHWDVVDFAGLARQLQAG